MEKIPKEALASGFLGVTRSNKQYCKKIIKKTEKNFKIVLTGGYSYLLKNIYIRKQRLKMI